ncbi:hypothetical protein DFR50_10212, partial [Roseiarcus fermentans]
RGAGAGRAPGGRRPAARGRASSRWAAPQRRLRGRGARGRTSGRGINFFRPLRRFFRASATPEAVVRGEAGRARPRRGALPSSGVTAAVTAGSGATPIGVMPAIPGQGSSKGVAEPQASPPPLQRKRSRRQIKPAPNLDKRPRPASGFFKRLRAERVPIGPPEAVVRETPGGRRGVPGEIRLRRRKGSQSFIPLHGPRRRHVDLLVPRGGRPQRIDPGRSDPRSPISISGDHSMNLIFVEIISITHL